MAIYVGVPAIDRAKWLSGYSTYINLENPADAAGTITRVELFADGDYGTLVGVLVATFYEVSPGYYSTRDYEAVTDITSGSKQVRYVNLDVEIGDYIGMCHDYPSDGRIEADYSGFSGIRNRPGKNIPCTNESFDFREDEAISLYGIAEITEVLTSTSSIAISTTSALSRGVKEVLTSATNIATSITSSLSRGIKEVLTSTCNIATSTTAALNAAFAATCNIATSITASLGRIISISSTASVATSITSILSRGIKEVLTSTSNIVISTTGNISRGIKEVLTSTAIIAVSITSALSRGVTEVLTSTVNIATSVTSALLRTKTELTSIVNIATSITGKLLKDYISLTISDRTYTSVTKADRVYTPVSDVTPSGTVEDKFTWNYINPNYDTWVELLAKEHWCDWYFPTPFTDAWSSLITPTKTYTPVTAPSETYNEVTKSDRTYTPIATPASTFTGVSDVTPDGTAEEKFTWVYIDDNFDTWVELLAKEHWCDWYFATKFVDAWTSKTTPSRTYTDVTKPEDGYVSVTTPDKEYKEVTKHQVDV